MPTSQDRIEEEYAAFHTALGELIREFTEFELNFVFALSALLGIDQFRARVLLGSIRSFDAKRRLIENLSATFASDVTHAKIAAVMVSAKNLSRNRNMVVHHLGGVGERTGQLVFSSDVPDDGLGTNFVGTRKVDLSNLLQWAKEAQRLTAELHDAFKGDGAGVFASAKMHRASSGKDGE